MSRIRESTRAPIAALSAILASFWLAGTAWAAILGDIGPYRARDNRINAADARVALAVGLGILTLPSNDALLGDLAPGTLGGGGPPAFTPGGDGAVSVGDAVVIAEAASGALALPAGAVTFPITIRIDAPSDGTFVLQSAPPVSVRYAADAGVDTATVALTANGAAVASTCAFSPAPTTTGSATCTPDLALPQGAVELIARAEDALGNAATDVVTVDVDSAPVAITLASPTDGFITTGDAATVSGTVGAGVARVEVAGIAADLNGASFSATVPLREGTQMLTAVAVKASGNTGGAAVEVTRDLFAPIARITSPADGFVSANATITVT
ncbi:MAG: hypothetical protein KC466_14395, partial [Myxococcales bacterium]|nr:hypothetical protein [Myxococcales bacterium]